MGVSASIDIQVDMALDYNFFSTILKLHNWDYNDYGFISYIKLGENDFDWTRLPYSEEDKVLSEIQKKLLLEEDLGIIITYKNSNIGGQLLYFTKKRLIGFNANINRVTNSSGVTNFEWYKNHLLPLFDSYKIVDVKYIEL